MFKTFKQDKDKPASDDAKDSDVNQEKVEVAHMTPAQPTPVDVPVEGKDVHPAMSPDYSEESLLSTNLKVRLHQKLLDFVNLEALEEMDRSSIARELAPILRELLEKERVALNSQEYNLLMEDLLNDLVVWKKWRRALAMIFI